MNVIDAPKIKLTSFSHGGGCGCKIAPALLSEILKDSARLPVPKELLVGIATSDDAAVYKLNADQALIATTDFFMPIVDDPYDFGRIAATNAISDVYAMGGKPIMALALVGMPIDKLSPEIIGRILAGGESICGEAGIPIAGGHSIDSVEPIYGLVVLGLVHPDKVKKNSDAKAGDKLVLGKPLGVGILAAAVKKDKIDEDGYRELIANTTRLNTPGASLSGLDAVHALTDVTGFGLLGHTLGLCRGAGLTARLSMRDVPLLPRVKAMVARGIRDRRFGPQLGFLRARRRARSEHHASGQSAADRSADQRRAFGLLRPRSGAGSDLDIPPRRLRARCRHRRDGRRPRACGGRVNTH